VAIGVVAHADAARDVDPATAMQLGAATYQRRPGPENATGLVSILTGAPLRYRLGGHGEPW
jgi:hypothetical protein